MKYIEITVTTSSEAEELVSDIFWQYSDFGVAISAVDDVISLLDSFDYYDYYDKSILNGTKGVSLVKCYLPCSTANEQIKCIQRDLENLRKNCTFPLLSLEMISRTIDGDDWIEVWKKHFKPIKIDDVTVLPEWINADSDEGITIKINSCLAFGTGEHESTTMAISMLQKYLKKDSFVIDVGTGSGILGITAIKLGASFAYMTDIDPVAVDVAISNAEINNVKEFCKIEKRSEITNLDRRFDLAVANITAEVLRPLSSQIYDSVKASGITILSGILLDRADDLIKSYLDLGFILIEKMNKGEWVCVVLKKL